MKSQNDLVFDILKNLAKRLINLQRAIANLLKIKYNELKIFQSLSVGVEMPQFKIGEVCGIDKAATSRILEKMEANGYISKIFKQGNKKTVYISLTEKGEHFNKIIQQSLVDLIPKFFNKLSEKDEHQFLKLIKKMLDKKI